MKTSTLFSPRAVTEAELTQLLGAEFDAAYFPEYRRWSIDADDGTVFVDLDPGCCDWLPDAERSALGFAPRAALHVHASAYHPGSPRLAAAVAASLGRLVGGVALAAA